MELRSKLICIPISEGTPGQRKRPAERPRAPGLADGPSEPEPQRPAIARDRLPHDEPALDQAVDHRGDRGLGDREPAGEQRRSLVAGRHQGEHAVLGERQLVLGRRTLQRAGGQRQRPGRTSKVGLTHSSEDIE